MWGSAAGEEVELTRILATTRGVGYSTLPPIFARVDICSVGVGVLLFSVSSS